MDSITMSSELHHVALNLKGILEKKGTKGFHVWKKRFFYFLQTPKGISLLYKDKEQDELPISEINLNNVIDIQYQNDQKQFTLLYPGRAFQLQAKNSDEAELWAKNIGILSKYSKTLQSTSLDYLSGKYLEQSKSENINNKLQKSKTFVQNDQKESHKKVTKETLEIINKMSSTPSKNLNENSKNNSSNRKLQSSKTQMYDSEKKSKNLDFLKINSNIKNSNQYRRSYVVQGTSKTDYKNNSNGNNYQNNNSDVIREEKVMSNSYNIDKNGIQEVSVQDFKIELLQYQQQKRNKKNEQQQQPLKHSLEQTLKNIDMMQEKDVLELNKDTLYNLNLTQIKNQQQSKQDDEDNQNENDDDDDDDGVEDLFSGRDTDYTDQKQNNYVQDLEQKYDNMQNYMLIEKIKTVKFLEKIIKDLKKEVKHLKLENSDKNLQLNHIQVEYKKEQMKNQILQQKFDQQEEQINHLNLQQNQLTQLVDGNEKDQEQLSKNYQNQIQIKDQNLKTVNENLKMTEEENENLRKQILKLKEELSYSNQEAIDSKMQFAEINMERDRLQETNILLEKQNRKLQGDFEELSKKKKKNVFGF